jgi:hypothetical protein
MAKGKMALRHGGSAISFDVQMTASEAERVGWFLAAAGVSASTNLELEGVEDFEVEICGLSDPAQAVFKTIKRETGLGNQDKTRRNDHAKILDSLLRKADTSPLGLIAMFPERFPGWKVETTDPVPTPHNVTIDIYGEAFHFKASADEARRLIKLFERVLAARKDVTRLKRELAGTEAKSFNGVGVGIGQGIMVDDPDAPMKESA